MDKTYQRNIKQIIINDNKHIKVKKIMTKDIKK